MLGRWVRMTVPVQPDKAALHHVLYRMAERATAGLSFYGFLQSVHELLGELLYARNFYVCLSNDARQTLDFPYYVDEKDGDTMQCNDVPMCRGLTEFVLRTQRPQLIDGARFHALVASGDVTEASGDLTFSAWLGVPMLLKGAVGGVLVVQNYEADGAYAAEDIEVLSFVANQFGSVIERHQAIEALRSSEARYRAVFEHLGVGVAVVQNGVMQFINPAMAGLLGWAREDLLGHDFTKALHPAEVTTVVDRHQRRLRGEAVEPYYVVRFVSAAGQSRHLEVSGALLDWNAQAATLLFAVDVTARVLAEQTQQLALERQRELNELRARFIAMASHEFRTPLASLSGAVELLTDYGDRLDVQDKQDALARMRRAVERMTHMLESVLRIGEIESSPMGFAPSPTAVAALCRSVVADVLADKLAHGRHVATQYPPDDVVCSLDDNLLRHILVNLLSNAIKYSPDGGDVCFTVSLQNGQLVCAVRDEGIGISEHDMPRLFDSFQRGSNVGHIPGTGLGLAIVKQAVNRHNGNLSVQSEPGKGTCFTVTVPAELASFSEPGEPGELA